MGKPLLGSFGTNHPHAIKLFVIRRNQQQIAYCSSSSFDQERIKDIDVDCQLLKMTPLIHYHVSTSKKALSKQQFPYLLPPLSQGFTILILELGKYISSLILIYIFYTKCIEFEGKLVFYFN